MDISHLVTEPELFKRLKHRAIQYQNNDHPGADKHIVPALDLLNQLDGVATVFSCEGHPGTRSDEEAYFILAVTERGYETVFNIHRQMITNLIVSQESLQETYELFRPNRLRLTQTVRVSPFKESLGAMMPAPSAYYNGLILGCTAILHDEVRNKYLALLTQVVATYVQPVAPRASEEPIRLVTTLPELNPRLWAS